MASDTTSTSSRFTIPISPSFSSSDNSSSAPHSEPTSDEQPDLGAFTTVLRAWTHFQPHPRIPAQLHSSSSSHTFRPDDSSISSFAHPGLSLVSSSTEELPQEETVWDQRPIQSYLDLYSATPSSDRLPVEDELELSSDNDNPSNQYIQRPSRPSLSPDSDEDSRTVEITSDIDIQDTVSVGDSLNDESTEPTEMALPVTVFSPNNDPSAILHGSDEGDNSSVTSREVPVHMVPAHSFSALQSNASHRVRGTYSHQHSPFSAQSPSHAGQGSTPSNASQSQLTPRRSEFPIEEPASPFPSLPTSRSHVQTNLQHSWPNSPYPPTSSTSHLSQPRGSYNAFHDFQSQARPSRYSPSNYSSSYHPADGLGGALRSLLSGNRTRSLVNDASSAAHSLVDDSASHSTLTLDHQPHYFDQSLLPTPESATQSLESHPHSLPSQSNSLISQAHPVSSPPDSASPLPSQRSGELDSEVAMREHSPHPRFSPQIEPPSPVPTPEDSETFLYSPVGHATITDGEAGNSHTPTGPVHNQDVLDVQQNGEQDHFQAISHPYPHPLTGIHGLPSTLETSYPQGAPARPVEDDEYMQTHPADFHAQRLPPSQSGYPDVEEDGEHPSLGLLDEALSFIAAERARFTAARETWQPADVGSKMGPGEWRHVVEPRRKRRRRKSASVVKDDQAVALSSLATRPLLLAADGEGVVWKDENSEHSVALISIQTPKKTRGKPSNSVNTLFIESSTSKSSESTKASPAKPITILARPNPAPPNVPVIDQPLPPTVDEAGDDTFNLMGKKGKRVGRREREREKAKRDQARAEANGLSTANPEGGPGDDWEADADDVPGKDDEDEGEGDLSVSSSSTGDLFVGGSAASRAHIHYSAGRGSYKSIPATPGTRTPKAIAQDLDLPAFGAQPKGADKFSDQEDVGAPTKPGRTRKKTRPKRAKSLVHAKSYPNFHVDTELDSSEVGVKSKRKAQPQLFDLGDGDVLEVAIDQNKRSRLKVLACKLQMLFPEQRKDLNAVLQRLDGIERKDAASGSQDKVSTPSKKRRGHSRGGSKGGSGTLTAPSLPSPGNAESAFEDEEQDPAEFEIQAAGPVEGSALIHVFIDHSNILIGLLNYLKRYPPPQSVLDAYAASRTQLPLSSHLPPTPAITSSQSPNAKPIPVPESGRIARKSQAMPAIESSASVNDIISYPIPLPSFATANANAKAQPQTSTSRSLPNDSSLDVQMAKRAKKKLEGVISDGCDPEDENKVPVFSDRKEKKFPRRLWHAAFALILERGRAISRRVVVTSSPLYQPMDNIQHLGYEVRVYIRVPDLGDGMDRERHREKEGKYGSGKSSGNGKGAVSSPVKNLFGTATPSTGARKGHNRHLSEGTSTESGSAGSGKPAANLPTSVANTAGTPGKVRYREQGVDELLQLKLHQALADADTVPKGSTIVLATGDGNVGQFNEDGFLGPVRTALKRGWKVELYAWEDGLSRSWRREFGENSEWGRKALFRIIPLEQFATSLVEAAGW